MNRTPYAALDAAITVQGSAVLTPEAVAFVTELHQKFDPDRRRRLHARIAQQARFDSGALPNFLPETAQMRDGDWTCRPAPPQLQRRWVEITGPAEAKMMVNALNSGADCFMVDFEDALSPTWTNLVTGQANVMAAVRGTLSFSSPEKRYEVGPNPATLIVRPRGWHLTERHLPRHGEPISASLFDAGLFLFHNAKEMLQRGQVPALYLPKMEHHLEARLWDDVLSWIELRIGIPRDSVRVTVLIETLPAAFQMEEILHELRGRIVGLNAGRWDYLFSTIKTLREHADKVLPDRAQLTMTLPAMRAYAQLLVATCHKRGVHAMGGMAAFIPNKRDEAANANAFAKVREDKQREAADGFDGTWVAHPGLVEVAHDAFAARLGSRANQLDLQPPLRRDTTALLDVAPPDGRITREGLTHNLRAALLYLESWLRGTGAVAIDNLMEDAATAEISRVQVWQWVRHGAKLTDGHPVTAALVMRLLIEEQVRVAATLPSGHRLDEACGLLAQTALDRPMRPFLTTTAYPYLV